MEGQFTKLPIDELFDKRIHKVDSSLCGADVSTLLTDYKEFVDFFASWSRIRLWFLHKWTVTTTSKPLNFLDWLKENAVVMTRNEIIEKFKTIHNNRVVKPRIHFELPFLKHENAEDEDWGRIILQTGAFRIDGERRDLLQALLVWPKGLNDPSTTEALSFYENVKTRLSEYLNGIVDGLRRSFEQKYEGNEEVFERGTIEPANRTEWFQRAVQDIYVIEMAFKVLGSLRECCEEVFNVLKASSDGEDRLFEGENARVLLSRIIFLMTLTVPVVMLVNDCVERQGKEKYYKQSLTKFNSCNQGNPDRDQMVEIPVQLPASIRGNCPGDLVYKRKFIGFNVHHYGHLYWKQRLVEKGRTQLPWFSIKNIKKSDNFMDFDFFQRRIQKKNGLYSM